MPVLNEDRHDAEFLVSESNGTRSREEETLALGNNLKAGAVLGKITATGFFAELNPAAADGSEVAAGILYANVDATLADTRVTVIVRDAELLGTSLQWNAAVTAPQQATATTQMQAIGLLIR